MIHTKLSSSRVKSQWRLSMARGCTHKFKMGRMKKGKKFLSATSFEVVDGA
jgi:hypothetical protein